MTRAAWAALAGGTIAAGLASRAPGLPALVHATVGDTLYATLCYCLAGVLAPGVSPGRRAAAALGWCLAVELSQSWHWAWLDSLRAHRLVALVLGRGFLWSDLGCYAVGVALPWGIERLAAGRRRASFSKGRVRDGGPSAGPGLRPASRRAPPPRSG